MTSGMCNEPKRGHVNRIDMISGKVNSSWEFSFITRSGNLSGDLMNYNTLTADRCHCQGFI